MFSLDSEFCKLPLHFATARLAEEVLQFSESEWRAHPQGHAGNSALPLVSVGGGINDEVKGPMRPTPFLARCPYLRQVFAAFGAPIGRARLMRIAGQSDATAHVDTNYYWMHHVRIHIPAVTYPQVRFLCADKSVHMAAGEAWIFDSWKLHNVINPVDSPRIHVVADTVGSAHFWEKVAAAFLPQTAAELVPFRPGVDAAIDFEEENFPLVMSPFEQQVLAQRMLASLPTEMRGGKIERALDRLHQEWHALWTRFRDGREGWARFRETIAAFDAQLPALTEGLVLVNKVPLAEALRQAIVRPAVNAEVEAKRALPPVILSDSDEPLISAGGGGADRSAPPLPAQIRGSSLSLRMTGRESAQSPLLFDRPVFIVAAPRSGSTMLFELLARSPDVWTVGGESHQFFENVPALNPANRGYESNALTAADSTPENVAALCEAFAAQLRDRDGNTGRPASVRFLEKTPKNALRIPFLAAAFPDARFIFLHREPRANLSSIIDAWRSQRFVTYPSLPGWTGDPWSLLLIPGWRDLAGKPLAEIAARQWSAANSAILDALAALPRDRWCSISYEEVIADPQSAAERLSAFAGWRWDQTIDANLPLSRHTLTPPEPEKWRANEAELAPVLPHIAPVAERILAIAGEALTPQPHAQSAPAPALDFRPSTINKPMPAPLDFNSEHTANFPQVLDALGISIAVSTYQAGKVILVRGDSESLNTHFRDFQSPMGLAYDAGRLAIGTRHEVWKLRNFADLGAKLEPAGKHDAVFLPAARFTTGDIRIHEIAWAGGELWAVNTRFSCLCTFDGEHNFIPRWRPPFISKLSPDDRCHLNGFAIIDDTPAYATCHGTADILEGWRANKSNGGCLLEIATGEVIAHGLSMPHSPRWHDGRLWLLESGHGRLSTVDLDTGKVETVAELPGFTRGLDFVGPFALVGLSQVRETAVFSGIPIAAAGRERECGVWVIDIRNGQTVAFLRFSGSVQEIFAVQVLPNMRWPEILTDAENLIGGAFYLPPEALKEPRLEPAAV